MRKVCSKCRIHKTIDSFYSMKGTYDNKRPECSDCTKKQHSKYNEKNRDKINARCRDYIKENKKQISERRKLIYASKKEIILRRNREWRAKNRDKRNEAERAYIKKRRDSEPLYKLQMNLRRRVLHAFSCKFWKKGMGTEKILGAEFNVVMKHIESKFKKGMTWDNHGHKGWHIDHVIPLVSAKTEEELIRLCHYTNLQPLWANENKSKGAKILPVQIKLTI